MKVHIIKQPIVKGYPIDTNDYLPFVEDFVETMKDKSLSIFYKNIRNANIEAVDKKILEKENIGAKYETISNTIYYDKEDYKNYIMHELFHMATCIITNDHVITGFMQTDKKGFGIGLGLNEGYTEYMSDKYFFEYGGDKESIAHKIYPITKMIAEILDILIGQEHLEDLYMKANLYKLFKELSFYSSEQKTLRFIKDMDMVFKKADFKQIPNIPVAFKRYSRIMLYLSECFMTKFAMMKRDNLLTDDEYNKSMEFVEFLMKRRICYFPKLKVIKSRKLINYYGGLNDLVNKKMNRG